MRLASHPIDPNGANDISAASFDVTLGDAGGRFVAIGDIDGDGQNEIVVATGGADRPDVRVFSASGADTGRRLLAFDAAFQGGVRVATCDVTGDGVAEIITAAGPGGGPHVRIWSAGVRGITELAGFFAYAPAVQWRRLRGVRRRHGRRRCRDHHRRGTDRRTPRARLESRQRGRHRRSRASLPRLAAFARGLFVAAGDVDGDGRAEVITGAGPGAGPHVRVWNLRSGVTEMAGFDAYDPRFSGGVSVATGDINGDGRAEIVTGPGPGGGPHVRVLSLSGGSVMEMRQFLRRTIRHSPVACSLPAATSTATAWLTSCSVPSRAAGPHPSLHGRWRADRRRVRRRDPSGAARAPSRIFACG